MKAKEKFTPTSQEQAEKELLRIYRKFFEKWKLKHAGVKENEEN